ncbi:uncharacterized protein LOC125072055 isoform X2 [Vanessa atalanta]|uniref:uncharacterized protein LOC125072055 isoform X2 n=1 Tax=Vanessa atalanta TaxID=42275 RepID=UPI001FCDBC2C|nr:uncharacterized protein LOC125072055 isoform X2 [Vanessa atalanta]
MSVIIRLQNLPWSANALDIRNFFRGLSIPEGGVHIVGGELGDAFIAFSTDEDARQAMMLDGGKIKEIQVKLLLSSRSEMHKVIETARQSVPLLTLAAPSPVPPPVIPPPTQTPQPIISAAPAITPFSTALGTTTIAGFGIPGIGNPQEIPQPAVIEPPAPLLSPPSKSPLEEDKDEEKLDRKRSKDKERRRSRSRSRSRDRERKERKRERRDRSRSRERRRRDRSRSRDRRDRKRDRKDRSRSRDRSPSRRSRDKRNNDRNKSPQNSQERSLDNIDVNIAPPPPAFGSTNGPQIPMMPNNMVSNGPVGPLDQITLNRPTNDNMQEQVIPRDPRQRRQLVDNGPSSAGAQIQGAVPAQFMPNAQFSQNFGGSFQNPQFGAFPSGGNLEPRAVTSNTWTNRMSFPKQSDQEIQASPMGKPKVISVNMEDEPLDCVLMKSLPREATDRTIVNFLADTGAVPSRIHLMLDANGLPSGDCFCEFRSAQEARKAATKHGQLLDGSRVTIDLVMRSVVEEALEGPKLETQPGILGNAPPPFMNMPRGGFMGRGQFRGRGMFERGGYDRGGFRGGFDPSRGGFDPNRGGFRGRGGWSERGMRGFDRGRGRGFARGRGGFDNMSMPMPIQMRNDEEQDPALENFGTPGCIVTMENVPFRATVDDIMTFFGDFELTQDDIIRRYNERGQPTGDARVAFRTPFDAQRAVKTRHMNTIFDRRINLTIL